MIFVAKVRHAIQVKASQILDIEMHKYECPLCNYYGPFIDINIPTGFKHAVCPKCKSFETHRLQKLVLNKLLEKYDFSQMRMLHVAPEPYLRNFFKKTVKDYLTVDMHMKNVDVKAELTNLPFKDAEYDFVFASHVLEYIKDDLSAVSEIKRVLKPTGIAILPVSIISRKTIESPEYNTFESNYVRAPGFDYYDRYCDYFQHIEKYSSRDFSARYLSFVYDNKSISLTKECHLCQPMAGEKYLEIIPVCFA